MENWNDILDSAMLGTAQQTPALEGYPASFAPVVAAAALDREERFLQLASLTMGYVQCGLTPLRVPGVALERAPAETTAYCSAEAALVLTQVLGEENDALLQEWLSRCAASGRIAPPDMAPVLLGVAARVKTLTPLVVSCCGERGKWLGRFNEAWGSLTAPPDADSWTTGTLEERRKLLASVRAADPVRGLDLLTATWSQEDAASRAGLLSELRVGLCAADLPFLEGLAEDKSKKVKDEALSLLGMLPGSSVVRRNQEALPAWVYVKKEKALLGMVSKTTAVFDAGAGDLVRAVPPGYWEEAWGMTFAQVIELFQKDEAGRKLIPSLILAIKHFGDRDRAAAFIRHSEVFYIDIIPLLPEDLQETYSQKFFSGHPDNMTDYALQRRTPWSPALARLILKHASEQPYRYTRPFFSKIFPFVPGDVLADLEAFAEDNTWRGHVAHITRLVRLRAAIIKAFHNH